MVFFVFWGLYIFGWDKLENGKMIYNLVNGRRAKRLKWSGKGICCEGEEI